MRTLGQTISVAMGAATILALSCGGDEPAGGDVPNAPVDGGSSGFQSSSSGSPTADSGTCAAAEATVTPAKRPVDIIFVIDNSDSMTEEIAEVEDQINANFAAIIGTSGVDYRVIMLSRHGENTEQRVCVRAPLSGTTCSPVPAKPVETATFFHHSVDITSTDAFCKLLTTFAGPDLDGAHPQGWGSLLRPNAFKVFAIITDDHVETACNGFTFEDGSVDPVSGTTAAGTFDSALLAMSPQQFGSVAARRYVWHSIVALAPFDAGDLAKPHPSTASIVTATCTPGAIAPGTGYQALSKLTGGLRYPTCGLDYTTIFQAMAKQVVDTSVVSCEFTVPSPPTGESIDLTSAIARFTAGNGDVIDFTQIPTPDSCGPGKFYVEDLTLKLCPDACALVQADPNAQLRAIFGCKPRTN